MYEELKKILFLLEKFETESKKKIFSQDDIAEQKDYLNEIRSLEPELLRLLEEIEENPYDLKIGDRILDKYYTISYGHYLEETRALVMKFAINFCEESPSLEQNAAKDFDTRLIGGELEKLFSLIKRLEQANKVELLTDKDNDTIQDSLGGLKEPTQGCTAYLKSIIESDIADTNKREKILEFLEYKIDGDYVGLYWLTAIIANVASKIEKLRTTKK